MPSFRDPLPPRDDRLLADYTAHLHRRNGTLIGRDRLELRDLDCERRDRADVVFEGRVDAAAFERQYRAYDRRVHLGDDLTAVLAFMKINAGEAYGVEVMTAGKPHLYEGDDVKSVAERTLLAEEHYHTRLLVGALNHFPTLSRGGPWKPAAPIRILVQGLLRSPERGFYPVLLASELAGIQAFTWLLNRLPRLFRDYPRVRQSLEERLVEVMVDEVGHIAYNRVLVGPRGAAFARWLAPQVLRGIVMNAPELAVLGLDGAHQRRLQGTDYRDLPEEVRRRAWFA